MACSVYEPLSSHHSIRLLEIASGGLDRRIECRLIPVSLHSCPSFDALSYVWGGTIRSKSVSCDGQNFTITQSLYDALHVLRLPHRPRLIWADAICIDQENVQERNQQVRIMRAIYATAKKVCVWLGPDKSGDAEHALVLMAAIVQTCESNARTRGRQWDELTSAKRVEYSDLPLLGKYGDAADPDSAFYWMALKNFFSLPWFSRVWCVQEIAMAQDSIIMYGHVDIPWRVVGITAAWMNSQQIFHDFNVPSLIEGIDAYNALLMYEAANPEEYDTLIAALRDFQDFSSTDPRDKIYAIMGLVEDRKLANGIPINYESSVASVYIQTAKVMLDAYKDLLVLACVRHPDTFETGSDLPSWTPRWDGTISHATMVTTNIGVVDCDWRASGDRKLDECTLQDNGMLSLRGVVFDSIDFVSNKMDYRDFGSSEPDPSTILSLWRKFIDPRTTTTEGIRKIISFALALTCETDIEYDHVMDQDDAEDRDEFFTDFLSYMMHLHDVEDQREQGTDIYEDQVKEDTRPSSFPSEDGDWKRYETAASRMCDQRRFFMTSRGHMGLGPASTRQGDVTAVLFGGRVPFTLRQADRLPSLQQPQLSPEVYYLLGEAFVQDIMRGEVVDGLADGQFVEVTFKII